MCGCLSHTPLLGPWSTTQACALMGNPPSNPLVHRPTLNPLSYTSQGSTTSLNCYSPSVDIWCLLLSLYLCVFIPAISQPLGGQKHKLVVVLHQYSTSQHALNQDVLPPILFIYLFIPLFLSHFPHICCCCCCCCCCLFAAQFRAWHTLHRGAMSFQTLAFCLSCSHGGVSLLLTGGGNRGSGEQGSILKGCVRKKL